MAIRHIIFDLDGTLMDTEKGNLYAWKKTLCYYVPGRTFSNTELKAILGVTTEKALSMLQVDMSDVAQFDDYWQLQYQTQVEHIAMFTGMQEVLNTLRDQGYTLGIVTSRDWKEYRAYFSSPSFDALFACIICKEDTKLHKPDPEPLLAYLRKMNAAKEDSIYIGDMDTDRECAVRAGVSFARAVWGAEGPVSQGCLFSPEQIPAFVQNIETENLN
ncbi:HAD family hydrolase [[Clostridium] innocuum]|nr:HAD family hydrolase [Erysipelotrichaceae bacterium]MCR0380953.1 HAD family hydrolase [[Clostridium] innocuum]MCR0411444.1 HAD family hydrolase [[Clostridium] innocuum]MCR0535003.1 HAD family hydrolase [[Clostridium] innocuum]MCR0538973.1 HAD family hydrolase [[Clostridium] innocuum]